MRKIDDYPLWIGNAGDARNVPSLLAGGIAAVVDLALNEPIAAIPRDLAYLRIPLVDGTGNPPWLILTAVEAVASLLRSGVPTLVFCGAGLSRSPSIVAAALAIVRGCCPDESLADICRDCAADVSPALWTDICSTLA